MRPLHLPWTIFWIGTALFMACAVGFGAVSRAVADWGAALLAWKIGLVSTVTLTAINALIWPRQRLSVRYVYIAKSMLCINLGGVFLAIGTPVFFVFSPGTTTGATLLLGASVLIGSHAALAFRHFRDQWRVHGTRALEVARQGKKLDAERFSKELRLSPPNIVQPGPPFLNYALPVVVVGLMFFGLSFRKAFPELTAIAWGMSSFVGFTRLFQIAILFVLQARAITAQEQRLGHALVPE